VLQLEGRTIGDSTRIIEALEAYCPHPPLYPDDPEERARALELEDYFDERLAPRVRLFVWQHTLDDAQAVAGALYTNPTDRRRADLMRRVGPLMRPAVKRDYRVNAKNAREAIDAMRAAIDRIEQELQPSGYLVGDRFSVADLTAAALFTPVVCPAERPYAPPLSAPAIDEVREELEARDGGRWIHEMYARHRGTSAEVPA
jgi:glutathione S-transferase